MAGPVKSPQAASAVCEMVDVAVNTELPLRLLFGCDPSKGYVKLKIVASIAK
jgi:hypothetical protein